MEPLLNYHGLADVLPQQDQRHPVWEQQRKTRGFDDTELWNLDVTIAKFILPRLIEFRRELTGHPGKLPDPTAWEVILDKMIVTFTWLSQDDNVGDLLPAEVSEGLGLFITYYRNLWT